MSLRSYEISPDEFAMGGRMVKVALGCG